MQPKILFKWSAFIAGIAVFLIMISFASGGGILKNIIDGRFFESVRAIVFREQVSHPLGQAGLGLPIRLKIPKIDVDSAVDYVGLTPDGAMDVSKSPVDVAWFNLGARPGENGSAVISGHYGWKNGIPAAFDDLYKLDKGDKIYVEDEKGVTSAFVVRESRRYDSDADAADVFGAGDGKAHLNLITCEGVWDAASKSYSKRLVVFTDKE